MDFHKDSCFYFCPVSIYLLFMNNVQVAVVAVAVVEVTRKLAQTCGLYTSPSPLSCWQGPSLAWYSSTIAGVCVFDCQLVMPI